MQVVLKTGKKIIVKVAPAEKFDENDLQKLIPLGWSAKLYSENLQGERFYKAIKI